MAFLQAFGSALPERIVTSEELAGQLGVEPDWILSRTGIRERRWAGPDETVVSLGAAAARACLANASVEPAQLRLVLVASGSPDRFCPGPATSIAAALGLGETPALDLPMASAGSLAGLVLASRLVESLGPILVVGAEIMSRRIEPTPAGKETAVLFGDGAGAALLSADTGFARIADSVLHSDGTLSEALRIEPSTNVAQRLHSDGTLSEALRIEPSTNVAQRLHMDGPLIIRHALRRMPAAMNELLARNHLRAADIGTFILHQANLNLLGRIARDMAVPPERFAANIDRFGNTSSASLLIAAEEWRRANPGPLSAPLLFSAFGAGLNWGALLAVPPAPFPHAV